MPITGRPSNYSQELAEEICSRIMSGESVIGMCREDNMPGEKTVYSWLAKHADFQQMYSRAREIQADRMLEEIIEIADDGKNDWMERYDPDNPGWQFNGEHVQRSRLRSDNRKWVAAKLAPKKYGDRVTQEHVGDAANPIATRLEVVLVRAPEDRQMINAAGDQVALPAISAVKRP